MKTVKDIDLKDRTVLLRADYNVPVTGQTISDDYRIRQGLPTLQFLRAQGCRVVIISHLGRPDGKPDERYSLRPVADRLSQLIDAPVNFIDQDIHSAVSDLKPGEVALLENLRFQPEEEANDQEFARDLASLAQVFVQDGFGVVHRAHASTDAITKFIPSVAGLLLEKEVTTITAAMEKPKHPLVAIIGGAKVSDKIQLIQRFVEKADQLIIGGAMANTFLAGDRFNYELGKSRFEDDSSRQLDDIWQAINAKFGVKDSQPNAAQQQEIDRFLLLPIKDVAVAQTIDRNQKRREVMTSSIAETDMVLDFGRLSTEAAIAAVKDAGTVIWNGPVGMTELPEFAKSSLELAEAIAESTAHSIVGGGDTAAFIESQGLIDKFNWVSTGGGAALDLMAGKSLPGVAALGRKT